jgi:hypothetical protein
MGGRFKVGRYRLVAYEGMGKEGGRVPPPAPQIGPSFEIVSCDHGEPDAG